MAEKAETEEEASLEIPEPQELLLSTPLYQRLPADNGLLAALRRDGVQFDCFCVQCGKDAPFKTLELSAKKVPDSLASIKSAPATPAFNIGGIFSVSAFCQRNGKHVYTFHFRLTGKELVKVGQWPSIEDIAGGDLEELRPVLSRDRFKELRRATGLASHGIGIGAFVYLRRIFEGLIHEHYQLLVQQGQEIEGWGDMRMDDKVMALSSVLPASLVANKAAYSILSSGIHQLDEQTCKKHFPFIRQAIIMILRDDLKKREERKDAEKLKHELGRIVGEVRGVAAAAKKSDQRTE